MKKWLAVILSLVLVLSMFAGCKDETGESGEEKEEEKTSGQCVLCPKDAKKDGLCKSCKEIADDGWEYEECVFCSAKDVNKYGMCSYCCKDVRLYARFGICAACGDDVEKFGMCEECFNEETNYRYSDTDTTEEKVDMVEEKETESKEAPAEEAYAECAYCWDEVYRDGLCYDHYYGETATEEAPAEEAAAEEAYAECAYCWDEVYRDGLCYDHYYGETAAEEAPAEVAEAE